MGKPRKNLEQTIKTFLHHFWSPEGPFETGPEPSMPLHDEETPLDKHMREAWAYMEREIGRVSHTPVDIVRKVMDKMEDALLTGER